MLSTIRAGQTALVRGLVVPLASRSLPGLTLPAAPIQVVFSNASTHLDVDSWLVSKPNWIHVSTVRRHNTVPPRALTRAFMRSWLATRHAAAFGAAVHSDKPFKRRQLSFPRSDHNTNAPNEDALFSLGFGFPRRQPILPPTRSPLDPYVATMLQSIRKLYSVRTSVSGAPGRTPQLILTTPDFYRAVRVDSGRQTATDPRYGDAHAALQLLRTQTNYTFLVDRDLATRFSGPNHTAFQAVLRVRTQELNLHTAGLSLRAAAESAAVCRLPPITERVRTALRSLADCYRGRSAQKANKLPRCFRDVQNALRDSIPDALRPCIDGAHDGMRIVSDQPFEWLPSHFGVPKMITGSVSRVTATPGNLLLQQLLPHRRLDMPPAKLLHVLLIRALEPSDPLYDVVRSSIEVYRRSLGPTFQLTVVDALTVTDIVNACNSFDGGLLVYDGHGFHGRDGGGILKINECAWNPWTSLPHVSMPPVVVLSACDTLPIDRHHPATANAFLGMGARAVVGSMLPIDGRASAAFVARLLHAVAAMVPALDQMGCVPIRWSDVYNRVLRTQFLDEVARRLAPRRSVAIDDLREYMEQTRLLVVGDAPNWLTQSLDMLSAILKVDRAGLAQAIDGEGLLQTYMYTHMGDPESIWIVGSGRDTEGKSVSAPPADA